MNEISQEHQSKVIYVTNEDLCERNIGPYEGSSISEKTAEEFEKKFAEFESDKQMGHRLERFWDKHITPLAKSQEHCCVLVISHSGPCHRLFQVLKNHLKYACEVEGRLLDKSLGNCQRARVTISHNGGTIECYGEQLFKSEYAEASAFEPSDANLSQQAN